MPRQRWGCHRRKLTVHRGDRMENSLSSDVLEQKLAELARENAELKARLAAMDAIAPTPPSEEADSCTFTDLFDLDEIQKIQDAFAAASQQKARHPAGLLLLDERSKLGARG